MRICLINLILCYTFDYECREIQESVDNIENNEGKKVYNSFSFTLRGFYNVMLC